MNNIFNFILPGFILLPVLGIAVMFLLRSSLQVLITSFSVSLASGILALVLAYKLVSIEVIYNFKGFFRADAFSAWHLVILTLVVFSTASLFSFSYFNNGKDVKLRDMKRFGFLWLGSLAAMSSALISGNIGIMWVSIEASTLFTAFLILQKNNAGSLEAMWKYIIMCSVGVAFAFIGTLLFAAAAQQAGLNGNESLLLNKLYMLRDSLNPSFVITGFLFILIGYGTKAGLAPMHNWLPDAHSQAPAPVSAMFSGFLLNTALYCIIRFLPIVRAAGGYDGKAQRVLMFFGIFSIILASIFIFFQKDAKRLLAYCSVEHLGIIALGYSLGPAGTMGALFHTLNHSIAKSTGFYSAGMLGKMMKSNDLKSFYGAAKTFKLWGTGLALSLMALIGLAPFAVFISEFQVIKATVDNHNYIILALFLAATSIVFIAIIRHAIKILWKPANHSETPEKSFNLIAVLTVFIPVAALILFGLWVPESIKKLMELAGNALWSVE